MHEIKWIDKYCLSASWHALSGYHFVATVKKKGVLCAIEWSVKAEKLLIRKIFFEDQFILKNKKFTAQSCNY